LYIIVIMLQENQTLKLAWCIIRLSYKSGVPYNPLYLKPDVGDQIILKYKTL